MINREELTRMAKEAAKASGLTQAELATKYGKSQSTINTALNKPDYSQNTLRVQMIRDFLDVEIEGPLEFWTIDEEER